MNKIINKTCRNLLPVNGMGKCILKYTESCQRLNEGTFSLFLEKSFGHPGRISIPAHLFHTCKFIPYLHIIQNYLCQPARLFQPARLLIFGKIPACTFISACTFINFLKNSSLHVYSRGYVYSVHQSTYTYVYIKEAFQS